MAALPALMSGNTVRPYVGRSRFVLTPLSLSLDQLLFLITAALLAMGLVMVQSADLRVRAVTGGGDWFSLAFNSKNTIHALIALAVMTVIWRLDYRWLLGRPVEGKPHRIL